MQATIALVIGPPLPAKQCFLGYPPTPWRLKEEPSPRESFAQFFCRKRLLLYLMDNNK